MEAERSAARGHEQTPEPGERHDHPSPAGQVRSATSRPASADGHSAARTPSKQPPMAGDRWRSRDRRDNDLIVRVLSVDSAFVYILRRRKSRVRLTRWHSEYEFVGQF